MAVSDILLAWEQSSKIDTLFILIFSSALLVIAVCSIQWWMIGYSIAYATGGKIISGFDNAFDFGVLANPIGTIPEILFSEFQLIFCAMVCAIAIGGACECGRVLPLIPFTFLWCTFVYEPLAHWSETGFLASLGVLSFAGGTPVGICSGASATALSVYLSHSLFGSE